MGTPTKSGIYFLLGHIYGYKSAWLKPEIILCETVVNLSTLKMIGKGFTASE